MRIFVKRMKKKLIMLLLVLTLVSVHALTAVSADEVSVNKETEAEASEEKEKKAEAVSGKEGSTKQEETEKKQETGKKETDEKVESSVSAAEAAQKKSEEMKADPDKDPEKENTVQETGAEKNSGEEETNPDTDKNDKDKEDDEQKSGTEQKSEDIKAGADGENEADTAQENKAEEKAAKEKNTDGNGTENGKGNENEKKLTAPPTRETQQKAKDVWIDNTVDNSFSTVIGYLRIIHDEGGETYKLICHQDLKVTFSNPKPQAVLDAIEDTRGQLEEAAESEGYTKGSFSEDMSTGRVWDNRKYTTIEDDDAILIGDTEYIGGTSGNYTRTHIADGDYGKETHFTITLTVSENPVYSISVNKTGKGTVTVDPVSAPEGTNVRVTCKADQGYVLSTILVRNDSVEGSDGQISAVVYGNSGMTEDSITFRMPASDTSVFVDFVEIPHDHDLVKTEKIPPSCEKEGTEAFWTCAVCGRMFSDEAGTKEIEEAVKIPASGHAWGEWVVTREATEDAAGEETRTCKNDPSHKETREIPAIGKKTEEKTEDKKEEKKETITSPDRDQDSGSDASDDNSSKTRKKKSSGKSSSKSASSKAKSPKTGDESRNLVWMLLAIASASGIMAAVVSRRGRRP